MNTKNTALLLILIIAAIPYVWNGYKFINCDFKSDYKCEVIHGAGVFVPPASWITVWFDGDDK